MQSSDLLIRNLNVSFGSRDIIGDVSLDFQTGLHYLIGLNGSGKSTLLHAINGLVSYQGEVLIRQRSLKELKARERARQICLLSQQNYLPFPLHVYDYVLMGRFPHLDWLNTYRKEDHIAAKKSINRLMVSGLWDRKLNELSGGEFQRVNLAKAICQGSHILLLDEPAQSLDPKGKAYLYNLIRELAQDHLIICATHDWEYIQPQDRVIGLKKGKIVFDDLVKDWDAVKKTVYEM